MGLIFFDLDGTLLPGTSASLEQVGFSVAVNGAAALQSKATLCYDGDDLLEAFHLMSGQITQ